MPQFTVHGYVDQVAYACVVDTDAPDGNEDGLVTHCSPATALAVLSTRIGKTALVTPSGPGYEINMSSPEGILAGLMAYTEVVRVDGDAPDLFQDDADSQHIDR